MRDYDDDYEDEDQDTMSEATIKDGDITVTLKASALNEMTRAVQYQVAERITAKVLNAIHDTLKATVDEAVRKVIGDNAEALVLAELERPRQKFNEWGTPTGPTVSFAELIPGVVQEYLSATVDDQGRTSGYSGDQKRTRVGWIIGQRVKQDIDPAIQNAVNSVTKQARDIVTAKVSAFVAEQMVPSIDVKKLGGAS